MTVGRARRQIIARELADAAGDPAMMAIALKGEAVGEAQTLEPLTEIPLGHKDTRGKNGGPINRRHRTTTNRRRPN
jgi:hypothetical protein